MTRREEIVEFLEGNPANAKDLADYFGVTKKIIEDDLTHLQKSLKRNNKQLLVKPAFCISCNFTFKMKSRIKDPKKCPECHNERISPSLFKIELKSK